MTRPNPSPSERRRIRELADAHGVEWQGALKTRDALEAMGVSTGPGAAVGPPAAAFSSPVEPPKPGGLRRLADVLRGKTPEPPQQPSLEAAFDGALGDEPLWPRNPVPGVSERAPRARRTSAGRPTGGEELQGLFATGLLLLLGWSLGDDMAPTVDEANAIALPLSNIVARRIDMAAKLGRDAGDVIALAVALMSYAYRVGPAAAERVRGSLAQRDRRERVIPTSSPGLADEASMAAWSHAGAGPVNGASYDPRDVVAQARTTGLGVLARDLGTVPNGGDPLGAGGQA